MTYIGQKPTEERKGSSNALATIPTTITLIFIALRASDVIHWSFWWVISPLWISFCLAVVVLLLMGIYAAFDRR